MALQAYATKIEIYDGDCLVCELSAFDEDSFMVSMDNSAVSPQDLREIADILQKEVDKNKLTV